MGKLFKRVLILGSLLCSTLNAETWKKVPLPDIKDPVTLRVVYAHNPRFRPLTRSELIQMLAHTKTAAQKHLGVAVTFTLAPDTTVKKIFEYLKPAVKSAREKEIYDFKRGKGDRTKLYNAFIKGLKERVTPLKDLIAYASPYLIHQPTRQTDKALAAALTDTLLHRILSWQELKAPDGKPVIDRSDYNEWTYWDSLGYSGLPYDIVITNTLVASVEYYGQDLHSAIRGGLTVGTTTNNQSGLGAYVFWSTFPFMEDYPLLNAIRDKDYTGDDALRLSGIYLAHEIGHLLFHYGHPFESDACIMTPVPMLHFKAWERRLDPEKCRSGNYPAMQKGAATIYYNPKW